MNPTVGAAIATAADLARQYSVPFTGTEHLLLGALAQTSDESVVLLAGHALTESAATRTYRRMFSRSPRATAKKGDQLVPLTPGAAEVLAAVQSQPDQSHGLGILLLALVERRDIASAVVRETLRDTGQPPEAADALAQALRASLGR